MRLIAFRFCVRSKQDSATGKAPDVTQRLREERAFPKKPAGGYVPDATTAVRIADAVLIPIYEAKQVGYENPFHLRWMEMCRPSLALLIANNRKGHLRRWSSGSPTI
jgi:hypothetical protein